MGMLLLHLHFAVLPYSSTLWYYTLLQHVQGAISPPQACAFHEGDLTSILAQVFCATNMNHLPLTRNRRPPLPLQWRYSASSQPKRSDSPVAQNRCKEVELKKLIRERSKDPTTNSW
ncbi:hypothetical protein B0H34DRAFT_6185 [Crassisporium funariophilum]|nr:hypothetical protein B0H34DRAFT_6185 [Crassisporium funariophilum]